MMDQRSGSEDTRRLFGLVLLLIAIVAVAVGCGQSGSPGGTGAANAPSASAAQATALPKATAPPAISGTARVGKVLRASPGTWSGDPTSYAYEWRDCNRHGAACTAITAATAATYPVGVADVGHTIRVVVAATTAEGSARATSAATRTASAPTNCLHNLSGCGYPDPTSGNVGPGEHCSGLTPSGSMTISTPGAVVQGMNITGQVVVNASSVTLTHDCITVNGGGKAGSRAVNIVNGASGTQIDNSDISGENASSEAIQEAVATNEPNSDTTVNSDYIYNCSECIHGAATVTNSYVTTNATLEISGPKGSEPDHYEDVYDGGGGGPLILEHNTMLNPHNQTAAVFASTDFGDQGEITITENLLAGGDEVLYLGTSGGHGRVRGPVRVIGNRFNKRYDEQAGDYGVVADFDPSVTRWSGNIWDETLSHVPL
jgi:hypothetical protein